MLNCTFDCAYQRDERIAQLEAALGRAREDFATTLGLLGGVSHVAGRVVFVEHIAAAVARIGGVL